MVHDRRVNHLNGCVMRGGQRVHDLVPDTSPPPANEAIIAGGIRPELLGGRATCAGAQNPEYAIEDTAVIYTWYAARLICGNIGLMPNHSQSVSA